MLKARTGFQVRAGLNVRTGMQVRVGLQRGQDLGEDWVSERARCR